MRVLVTAVRAGAEPQDVLVTADDSATVADIAAVLANATGATRPPGPQTPPGEVVPLSWSAKGRPDARPTGPTLWADGRACHPTERATSVLRDGMRVSVDDTVGPLMRAGEPSGRYELRVAGDPERVAWCGWGREWRPSARTRPAHCRWPTPICHRQRPGSRSTPTARCSSPHTPMCPCSWTTSR